MWVKAVKDERQIISLSHQQKNSFVSKSGDNFLFGSLKYALNVSLKIFVFFAIFYCFFPMNNMVEIYMTNFMS